MSSKITVQTAPSTQSKKTRYLTFNDLEIGDVFEWDDYPNELCLKCTKKHYRWLTLATGTETETGMVMVTAMVTEMEMGSRVIRYDLTLVKSNPVSEIECK